MGWEHIGKVETAQDRQSRQQRTVEQQKWEEGQKQRLEEMKAEQAEDNQAELDRKRRELYEVIANQRIAENREETASTEQLPVSVVEKEHDTSSNVPVKKTGFAGFLQRATKSGRAERAQADSLQRADDNVY